MEAKIGTDTEYSRLMSLALYFLEVHDDGKWSPSDCAWAAHSCVQRASGFLTKGWSEPPELSERAKQMIAQMEMETAIEEALHSAREAYPYGKS